MLNGIELQARNEVIGLLNEAEYIARCQCLSKTTKKIPNPWTVIKKKLHKIEDTFYDKKLTLYTNSEIGEVFLNYYFLHKDIMSIVTSFEYAITFEEVTMIEDDIKLPLPNPFLSKYLKLVDAFETKKIEDILLSGIKNLKKEELDKIFQKDLEKELISLGYPKLLEKVSIYKNQISLEHPANSKLTKQISKKRI